MDDKQYRDWVASLTELNQVQLSDVSNRLKILSFATTKEFNSKSDFGVRVTEAICRSFRSMNVECPSPNTLRKSSAYSGAKDKFDDLAAFFEKISQNKLVQDRALVIAIEGLYVSLQGWGIAVSSHTILQQVHRLPSILNQQFPGYSASNLLHKIVRVNESSDK